MSVVADSLCSVFHMERTPALVYIETEAALSHLDWSPGYTGLPNSVRKGVSYRRQGSTWTR